MTLNTRWNSIIDYIINQTKTITEFNDDTLATGFDATNATSATGTLHAVELTGLQPGQFLDSFDLEVSVAAGNCRIKVYDDLASAPGSLLGESNSLAISSTGFVNFRLQKQVEVPIDGVVWLAYENDNASLDIVLSTAQVSGSEYTVSHTFGVGPSSFSGAAGTSPFSAVLHYNPSVVKHYGIRGSDIEDFFAIVSAGQMVPQALTFKGSDNEFRIFIDVSFRGEDFQNGLTQIISITSEIYDLLHMTTLGGNVKNATVSIFPDEILEGERLYLIGARVEVVARDIVIQV